jgi:large conductance mechanosensitive channel
MLGGVDFTDLAIVLKEVAGEAAAVTINYGVFVQTLIDFIIVAFAIFMAVKAINAMRKAEEEAPSASPAPSKEEILLTEIRDLLKQSK